MNSTDISPHISDRFRVYRPGNPATSPLSGPAPRGQDVRRCMQDGMAAGHEAKPAPCPARSGMGAFLNDTDTLLEYMEYKREVDAVDTLRQWASGPRDAKRSEAGGRMWALLNTIPVSNGWHARGRVGVRWHTGSRLNGTAVP